MLTRFELMVILRNQVADRDQVRRALAVEAVLEEWAGPLAADVEQWRLAGLGSRLDVQLQAGNLRRQGEVAAELLRTEGAEESVALAVAERLGGEVEKLSRLGLALGAAEIVVAELFELVDAGDKLDGLEPFALEHRVRRKADKRGDERAQRALALLSALGLELAAAASLALAGIRRVREDLRL